MNENLGDDDDDNDDKYTAKHTYTNTEFEW